MLIFGIKKPFLTNPGKEKEKQVTFDLLNLLFSLMILLRKGI